MRLVSELALSFGVCRTRFREPSGHVPLTSYRYHDRFRDLRSA